MIDLNHLKFTAETTKEKHGSNCAVLVASGDVLHLLDMIEAAKLDAARYQWLRDECTASQWPEISAPHSRMLLIGATLDAAIDAAMAATKGEQA